MIKKISIFLLMTLFAIVIISVSSCDVEKEKKQDSGKQQQTDSKIRLSFNLKKGYSCYVDYDANINISQEGQSDGTGEWKVKANLLFTCDDVNDTGIMTISQSPLKISIEGTGIEGKYEVDFQSPDNNRQIPQLVRGHLRALIAIKSARVDANGKIIAARQSPDLNNYDFMALGKISYQDDLEWISPDGAEDAEKKVKYIVNSMLGVMPLAMGKEFTIGKTLTIKGEPQNEDATQEASDWTLKDVNSRIAQFEVKSNSFSERKGSSEFVDEVEELRSSSEELLEFNIDSGLILKCLSNVEYEHHTMTFVPLLSERVSTFSNLSKITA